MKTLSVEIKRLLDKLYNLRGSDSVILKSMDTERKEAENTKTETASKKEELSSQISKLTEEENILSTEGDKLLNALSSIKSDDFSTVLKHLNINFNPEEIKAEVEKALPSTMEKVASEIEENQKELVSVENKMNDAITRIEELGIRKDEALKNQEMLNHYFDLALANNINITRDEVTSLLKKFAFNEEEQREGAKLIMFPEDGLFDYDAKINNKEVESKEVSPVKSIGDVILEAKEATSEHTVEVQEEEITESQKEEPKEITKDDLVKKLTELGFDYLDFTSNDFTKMLENFDADTFAKNANFMSSLNISKDIFNDNIELLYDKDLELKVKKILEIGKQAQDIYLNPNILVKYTYVELEEAIKLLYESGLDPKSVPLMAY